MNNFLKLTRSSDNRGLKKLPGLMILWVNFPLGEQNAVSMGDIQAFSCICEEIPIPARGASVTTGWKRTSPQTLQTDLPPCPRHHNWVSRIRFYTLKQSFPLFISGWSVGWLNGTNKDAAASHLPRREDEHIQTTHTQVAFLPWMLKRSLSILFWQVQFSVGLRDPILALASRTPNNLFY